VAKRSCLKVRREEEEEDRKEVLRFIVRGRYKRR
jgi:hypothetical protein